MKFNNRWVTYMAVVITAASLFVVSQRDAISSYFAAVRLIDDSGVPFGVSRINNHINNVSTDYTTEIALGHIVNSESRSIMGYNSNVAGTLVDMTETGHAIIPRPATFERMNVASTSANDASAGTGVRTIDVFGLSSSFNELVETVTLRGITNYTTVNFFSRVNAMHSKTVGSGSVASGNITVKNIAGTNTYNQITAGGNMSLQAHYTVPKGHKMLLYSWTPAMVSDKTTVSRSFLRATVDWDDRTLVTPFMFQDIVILDSGGSHLEFNPPLLFPAKSDIKISSQRILGTGQVVSSGSFRFHQELE